MENGIYQFGPLVIDCGEHRVTANGREAKLTRHEYQVLCLLAANSGEVVKIEQFLHQIWGPEYRNENELLHVAVSRIRRKLDRLAPGLRDRIRTVYGFGYVLLSSTPEDSQSVS